MIRYFRLYLYFLRFSFSKALEFRLDFTFKIVMDIFYYAVNILFFKIIYTHTGILGGWSEEHMMVFVASFLLVDALAMTIFSSNMWWLPILINRGDLDYYLIRPVSPLFFLSLREFSANSFINLLMAVSFFCYSLFQTQSLLAPLDVILLIILLLNGTLIYYCLQLLMIIPVFWTQSPRGFVDLFYALASSMERPDKIYKGWLRFLFTMLLPFSLIASFPAKIFIEKNIAGSLLHILSVSLFLWVLVGFFWKKGLKNYSSASS